MSFTCSSRFPDENFDRHGERRAAPAIYTIAVRESGARVWHYIGSDLRVRDTSNHCKPLTRAEAADAKQIILDGCAKAGRKVQCRIVILADFS